MISSVVAELPKCERKSKSLLTGKLMDIAYCDRQAKSTRAAAPEPSRQNGTTSNGELLTRPAALEATESSSSLTAGQSHQDRIASAKEKALKRVQERLAAAGIKTGDTGESLQQRQERERKEREDRVKKAEAEDAKREQERQQRLAQESGTSPSSAKGVGKKPPPPPSRKGRQDSTEIADKKAAEAAAKARAEEDAARELRAEQEAQEAQRKQLEYAYPYCPWNYTLTETGPRQDLRKTSLKKNAKLPRLV